MNLISPLKDLSCLRKWATQLVSALAHLQLLDLQHRNLIPENIYIDSNGNLKVFNAGVYYLTSSYQHQNSWTSYTICPPEILDFGTTNFSSFKADVWALGLLIFQLFTGATLLPSATPKAYFDALLDLTSTENLIIKSFKDHPKSIEDEDLVHLQSFLINCLKVDPNARPTPVGLLTHPFLLSNTKVPRTLGSIDQSTNLYALFHLWLLDGGSLHDEFTKTTGVSPLPPILTFPFISHGEKINPMKHEKEIVDAITSTLTPLLKPYSFSFPTLSLSSPSASFVPPPPVFVYASIFLIDFSRILAEIELDESLTSFFSRMVQQPLPLRLKSISYQFHRIQQCTDVLLQYPITSSADLFKDVVCNDTPKDIPAYLRGSVWISLLNVPYEVMSWQYTPFHIKSLSEWYDPLGLNTVEDQDDPQLKLLRQLAMDLPRCHAYSPLIRSSLGQQSIQSLLMTWLKAYPHYVYWQGMDSVCAVLISLYFPHLHLAYGSLVGLVERYFQGLWVAQNQVTLEAHFGHWHSVLTYLDPFLASKLNQLHLMLQHFGISWLLTLFAHDFEFKTVYLLWDHLLSEPFSSPFMVMSHFLRLPYIRSKIMKAVSLEEGLHAVSEIPAFDVFELLQRIQHDLNWVPKSTLLSFHFKVETQLPRISFQDCLTYAMDLRIIDLRPLNLSMATHLPGSTIIAPRHLPGIESILKDQRNDKKITVLRFEADPYQTEDSIKPKKEKENIVLQAWQLLASWCIPGLCCLYDTNTDACSCSPHELHFPSFNIYKCRKSSQ
ncbi:hypothetical protein HMI55_001374 [Coelomomyces lativittatus]|nr:hypothetical protein HMI55_001374 [Coelomomyces lativittatus]